MEARKRKRTCRRSILASNMERAGMKRKKREELLFLPDDVIDEILSWLPVKSVLRCKCVCKSWQIITQQSCFIVKHQRRSKCQEIVYETKYKSKGSDETYIFNCYSNGLVLEKKENTEYEYRVRNPATKQVVQVWGDRSVIRPEHLMRSISILGFDSSTSNYKMMSLDWKRGTFDYGISMLTIGSDQDHAWRSFDITFCGGFTRCDVFSVGNNHLNYFISFLYFQLEQSEIVRISLDGKSSMLIKPPQSFTWDPPRQVRSNDLFRFQTFMWDEEKLSIGFIIEQNLHLWVLENDNKHIWSDKMIIPLDFMKDYPNPPGNISVSALSKSQMRVSIDNHHLQYDIHSNKYTCLAKFPPGEEYKYDLIPSLVSLKGMHSEL